MHNTRQINEDAVYLWGEGVNKLNSFMDVCFKIIFYSLKTSVLSQIQEG